MKIADQAKYRLIQEPTGFRRLVSTLIAVLAVAAAASSQAQEDGGAPGSARVLEEITVTATRREASIVEVPQTVTVLTGDWLSANAILRGEDYLTRIPGVSFNRTGNADRVGLDIAMRGVSNTRLIDAYAGAGAMTTGYYLDDVAMIPVNLNLYDIERIEILKGPQGTLFGQSSMGGTVRVITEKPDPSVFSAGVELRGSFTDGGGDSSVLRGFVNLPLIENVSAIRLVGFSESLGGWLDWTPTPLDPGVTKNNYRNFAGAIDELGGGSLIKNVNTSSLTGGRIAFSYQPTENLLIEPTLLKQQRDTPFESFIESNISTNMVTRAYNPEPRYEDFWKAALTVNYTLPFAQITSISGLFNREYGWRQDSTSFTARIFGRTDSGAIPARTSLDMVFETETFTQEIRAASTGGRHVDWIVGAYFRDETRYIDQIWEAPGFNEAAGEDRILGGIVQAFAQKAKNETKGAFADLTVKLFEERLRLTIGARYFDDEWSTEERGITGALTGRGPGDIFIGGPSLPGSQSGTTGRIVAQYTFRPETNVYASVSEGFRAGGGARFDEEATPLLPACRNALNQVGVEPGPFESDSLTNYELGFKSRLRNRRVSVEATAFRIDWKDLQSNISMNTIDPGCILAFTTNVGSAKIRGAELLLSAQVTERLQVSANATYTKSELGPQFPGTSIGAEGEPLQLSPKWQGVLSLTYSRELPGGYAGHLHVDGSYTDSQVSNQIQHSNPNFSVPSRNLVNLRAGFTSPDDSWGIDLYVQNALNELLIFGAQTFAAEPNTKQTAIGRPREIGVVLRYFW